MIRLLYNRQMHRLRFPFLDLAAFALTMLAASTTLPMYAEEFTPHGLRKITILQLNDVYQELPVDHGTRGGFARVATLRKQVIAKQPDTLFMMAGDTLSPSVASRIFKGAQMVAGWNAVGLDFAVFGNHEFDFGPEVLKQRIAESKFTWVCANAIDKRTGKTFAGVPPYVIRELGGIKVGVIGLLTADTEQTSHAGPDIEVQDPCQTVQRLVPQMRKEGAQVVVALTHLTMANDKQICHCAPIDAVIGGHEHYVMEAVANGTPIVKAGSDARLLGKLDISYDTTTGKVYSCDYELLPVTDKIPDDPAVAASVAHYENQLSKSLDEDVATTTVELDATQASNQARETNLADLIADAYRAETGADIGLLNGGSVRSNTTYGPGKLTRRNILEILPFENPVVKLEVSGAIIRQALENGVSQIGIKPSGRLAQVSGLQYEYDARKPPGARIVQVLIAGQPLRDDRVYTLATNNFVAAGGDGYVMFKQAKLLITPEQGNSEAVTLLNQVQRLRTLSPRTEERIKRLDL
jgi:5'-nucleotidase